MLRTLIAGIRVLLMAQDRGNPQIQSCAALQIGLLGFALGTDCWIRGKIGVVIHLYSVQEGSL